MVKQTPSAARLATMVVFSLTCFGLLLFLWVSFGGPIPLKPKGYRVQVAFKEAANLGLEADVRIAGVRVGKVRKKRLDPNSSRTLTTLQIEARHAPLPADTRAMLRVKTLLGETFVELTPGSPTGPKLPEGGRLPDGRVEDSVELDEVFSLLDEPTRAAFKAWQRDFGAAFEDAGRDVNDSLGRIEPLAIGGADLMERLDAQRAAVRGIVRDSGEVFAAISRREGRLRTLVRSSADVFATTARRNEALADTVRILPTFLRETRSTLTRTETFARDTQPLVRDLEPALAALTPALDDARAAAPDIRRLARALPRVFDVSASGLPAGAEVFDGLKPLLAASGELLSELNPILEWLEYNQNLVMGFFNAPTALADTITPQTPNEIGHYLRSLAPVGLESIALWSDRLPTHRGNAYLQPYALGTKTRSQRLIQPSWDCDNTGRGEFTTQMRGTNDDPSCWREGFPGLLGPGEFPKIGRADYSDASEPPPFAGLTNRRQP